MKPQRLLLQTEATDWSLADDIYLTTALQEGLDHEAKSAWHTDVRPPIEAENIVFESRSTSRHTLVVRMGETLGTIAVNADGNVTARCLATTAEAAKTGLDALREYAPTAAEAESGRIGVRFWYLTEHGPRHNTRKLSAPLWPEIVDNYAGKTRDSLTSLMDESFRPSHGGQIILWHGPPGTGKTFALRALCQAWKSWCSAEYVVDPERLWGKADYLMPVLLAEEQGDEEDEEGAEKAAKWRLLIMEDTGELVREDAKEQTQQGLSRLLNVADGFIGQGLRVLLLITTNETIEKMHPAVSRPGRAARNTHFDALDADDIRAWAKARGVSVSVPRDPRTLADLYAEVDDFAVREEPATPVGFRAPRGWDT